MKENNTNKLGNIIKKLMKNPKLADKMEELDALEVWKQLIGTQLQKYVTDAKIYKGVLYVQLNSSTLRNELAYQKSDIINRINKKINKKIIQDIVLK